MWPLPLNLLSCTPTIIPFLFIIGLLWRQSTTSRIPWCQPKSCLSIAVIYGCSQPPPFPLSHNSGATLSFSSVKVLKTILRLYTHGYNSAYFFYMVYLLCGIYTYMYTRTHIHERRPHPQTHLDADGGEFPPWGAPGLVWCEADADSLGLSCRRGRRAADTGARHWYRDGGHQGDWEGNMRHQGNRSFGKAARPRAGGAVRGVAACCRLAVGLAALLQVGVLRRLCAALHRHWYKRLGRRARRNWGRSLITGCKGKK